MLTNLSNELLLDVLSRLEFADLNQISLTNKGLHNATRDQHLWQTLFLRDFPEEYKRFEQDNPNLENCDYFKGYKEAKSRAHLPQPYKNLFYFIKKKNIAEIGKIFAKFRYDTIGNPFATRDLYNRNIFDLTRDIRTLAYLYQELEHFLHCWGIEIRIEMAIRSQQSMEIIQGLVYQLTLRDNFASTITPEFLELLLRLPRFQTPKGQQLIHAVSESGRTDLIKLLIDAGVSVNSRTISAYNQPASCTALHLAVLHNQYDAAVTLLDAKAEVDARIVNTSDGPRAIGEIGHSTALHIAAAKGHAGLFALLLARGANPGLLDGHKNSTLHSAAAGGNVAIIKELLLTKQLNPDQVNAAGETPLFIALENGHVETTRALLAHGAKTYPIDALDNSALHVAIEQGDPNLVEAVLTNNQIDVNSKNMRLKSPLQIALREEDEEIIFKLLQAGAEVESTLLYKISKKKQVSKNVFYALLDAYQVKDGYTKLHFAALSGDTELIERLLLKKHGDISVKNRSGQTPLHFAVLSGQWPAIQLFLDKGADIYLDDQKESLLFCALERKEATALRVLTNLLSGADHFNINAQHLGKTLLQRTIEKKFWLVARFLLEKGARVIKHNLDTTLHVIAYRPCLFIAKELILPAGASNNSSVESQEIIPSLIRKACEAGVNVNARDKDGQTALHLALQEWNANIAVIHTLLSCGADVNCVNYNQQTPLQVALSNRKIPIEVVKLLLARDADPAMSVDLPQTTAGSRQIAAGAITQGTLHEWAKMSRVDNNILKLIESAIYIAWLTEYINNHEQHQQSANYKITFLGFNVGHAKNQEINAARALITFFQDHPDFTYDALQTAMQRGGELYQHRSVLLQGDLGKKVREICGCIQAGGPTLPKEYPAAAAASEKQLRK